MNAHRLINTVRGCRANFDSFFLSLSVELLQLTLALSGLLA